MAGRGPAPKDPNKRARANKDIVPLRVLEVQPAEKPDLPSFNITVTIEGELSTQEFTWPEPTVKWWADLDLHPLAYEFIETDWSYLLDTARIHAEFWTGKMSMAAELRLREAKYGFTPEDRARLRIQFAEATGAEIETAKKVQSSRERFGGVKRLDA